MAINSRDHVRPAPETLRLRNAVVDSVDATAKTLSLRIDGVVVAGVRRLDSAVCAAGDTVVVAEQPHSMLVVGKVWS